jgi:hypothetical protein
MILHNEKLGRTYPFRTFHAAACLGRDGPVTRLRRAIAKRHVNAYHLKSRDALGIFKLNISRNLDVAVTLTRHRRGLI